MSDWHRYGAHGVTIRTNRPIDGMLAPIDAAPEVTIDFAGIGEPPSSPDRPVSEIGFETLWHLDASTWLLRYASPLLPRDAWSVTIRAEGMSVCWTAGIPFADIPPALQGSAFGAMLLLRGVPLLHGSAVDAGGEAIILVGDSGAGKSTTAGAFLRRGRRLLADDTAALEVRGDRVWLHPGLPRLRMNPDSAAALGWTRADVQPVFASEFNDSKWAIHGGLESAAPLPVRAIYVLRPRSAGTDPRIETIAPRAALRELLRNAYGAPYLDAPRLARLFRSFSAISERVPVREVSAPDSLQLLPRLIDALLGQR